MSDELKNGCYNREPFRTGYTAPDGYFVATIDGVTRRLPKMSLVKAKNSTDCQYSKNTLDEKCTGCKHNEHPIAQVYRSKHNEMLGRQLGMTQVELDKTMDALEAEASIKPKMKGALAKKVNGPAKEKK